MTDNKMYYIQNLEALKDENAKYRINEYELHVDSHFVGEFNRDPYEIMLWEIGLHSPGEDRKIILRVKEVDTSDDSDSMESYKKDAFYHGGGVEDEIVSLASLFLRRKIKKIHCVREDNRPIIVSLKSNNWKDKDLISGRTDLKELHEWFDLIEGLDEKYHQKFVLAARLYHRSILMIEDDPDLAYLTLVSAIETLCQDHPLKENPTLSQISPELDREIDSLINDKASKNKLKDLFLKNNRFISRRFVDFIVDYTGSEFWNYENRPEHGRIKKEDLERYLKKIYQQRSRTLHEGQAFFPLIFYPPIQNEEICSGLSFMSRGKIWYPKDYIPSIHFFERLVNNVLKNFLIQKQINKGEEGKN